MIYGAKINRKSKDGFNIHTITEIDGVKKSLQEWVKISGVDRTILKNRYKKGIRGKELLAPVKRRNEKFVLSDAEAKMIEDNFKLVYKGWHHLRQKYPFMDDAELYDCCIDAIIYVARTFDESRGKISTLFYVNAESNAKKQMDYWNAKKREGTKLNFSIDYNFENSGDDESFIEHYLGVEDEYGFIDKEETIGLINKAFSVLTEREKKIMYKFVFKEMQKKDIAEEIGMSPMTVGRAINSATEKIRSRIEGVG